MLQHCLADNIFLNLGEKILHVNILEARVYQPVLLVSP